MKKFYLKLGVSWRAWVVEMEGTERMWGDISQRIYLTKPEIDVIINRQFRYAGQHFEIIKAEDTR